RRLVVVRGNPNAQPAGPGMRQLLGQDQVREVVAALAAVGLGHREPEKPELAHPREERVSEGRLLPLLRVRGELLHHERVDRLAQRLVLLAEDEVLARSGVIGLLDIGRGHSANLRAAVRVGLQMPYETVSYSVADRVATVAMNRTGDRNALSAQVLDALIAALTAPRDDDGVRCVVLTSTHEKVFSAG